MSASRIEILEVCCGWTGSSTTGCGWGAGSWTTRLIPSPSAFFSFWSTYWSYFSRSNPPYALTSSLAFSTSGSSSGVPLKPVAMIVISRIDYRILRRKFKKFNVNIAHQPNDYTCTKNHTKHFG